MRVRIRNSRGVQMFEGEFEDVPDVGDMLELPDGILYQVGQVRWCLAEGGGGFDCNLAVSRFAPYGDNQPPSAPVIEATTRAPTKKVRRR